MAFVAKYILTVSVGRALRQVSTNKLDITSHPTSFERKPPWSSHRLHLTRLTFQTAWINFTCKGLSLRAVDSHLCQ